MEKKSLLAVLVWVILGGHAYAKVCVADLSGLGYVFAEYGERGGKLVIFGENPSYATFCDNLTPNDTVYIYLTHNDDYLAGLSGSNAWADPPDFAQVLIYGSDGNDQIYGPPYSPGLIYGEDGDDYLEGGFADDTIFGGNGRDVIIGDWGNDLLVGENGCDTIFGGGGDDTIHLAMLDSADDDCHPLLLQWAYGDAADLTEWSETITGNDIIYGTNHRDKLVGGPGNDILFGGDYADCLCGEYCKQYSQDGDGDDIMFGEGGTDSLCDRNSYDKDYFIGGSGYDYSDWTYRGDKAPGIESNGKACSLCATYFPDPQ